MCDARERRAREDGERAWRGELRHVVLCIRHWVGQRSRRRGCGAASQHGGWGRMSSAAAAGGASALCSPEE